MSSQNLRLVSCWSKAGIGTSIVLEYNNRASKRRPRIVLDLGATPVYEDSIRASTILISHGHIDHVGAIFSHARAHAVACGGSIPTYYVPEAIRPQLEQAREAMAAVDAAGGHRESLLHCKFVGVQAGDEVDLKVKGAPNLFVRVFGVEHAGCPAVGYVIGSRQQPTLKPEYQGLAGTKIRDLISQGIQVKTEASEVLEVAYTGDTGIDGLVCSNKDGGEREQKSAMFVKQAFQCGLLFCEATFLEGTEKAKKLSAERGHLTIHEIAQALSEHDFVNGNNNGELVLLHISARYNANEALKLIEKALPSEMARRCRVAIKPLMIHNHEERSWASQVRHNGCILLSDYIRSHGKKHNKRKHSKGNQRPHGKPPNHQQQKPRGDGK